MKMVYNRKQMDKQKRILVVEDEEYLRDIYVRVLEGTGKYEVGAAEDGEVALEKVRQGGFNLILLDVMLPKIDGFQVLNKMQEEGLDKKNGQIIVLTNLDQEAEIAQGASLGVRGYIIKSDYTPEKLVREVERIMSLG
jgi:two-component system response regulator ResD